MNADLPGRARLLADVLGDADLALWRERLRGACVARLDPSGRASLLRDVLRDTGHVAFEARLRAARGTRLPRAPRRLPWLAAALLVLLGAWLIARQGPPAPSQPPPAPVLPPAPTPRYEVRTQKPAPTVRAPSRLTVCADRRLDVVSTRAIAARLVVATARPLRLPAPTPQPPLERLDDAGLLALLPGRPSAIVETAPGIKRLVLLDPADEAALVAPPADDEPR
jgi:hypothetical protein